MSATEIEMARKIAKVLATGTDEWEKAVTPMKADITEENKADLEKLVTYPKPSVEATKKLESFKTDTFLDEMYLNIEGEQINGVPDGIQIGVTGLPSSGKSILIEELAVRKSSQGIKVLLVTSEDLFESKSGRMDLQARLKQKADILGIDWDKQIEQPKNLIVLDTYEKADLRRWTDFAKAYRYVIEKHGVKLVLVDSVTLLETYRGALKNRLQELCRYNQKNGITGIYVNQRATEDWDTRAMAGGIGIGHILDSTVIIDYGRTYHGDVNKDLGTKRGTQVQFVRVLGCRLCGYDGQRKHLAITKDGFLKKFELEELQEIAEKAEK